MRTVPKNAREARRKAGLLARLAETDPDAGRCAIPGCGSPVQATTNRGLSATLCRRHVQLKARHGCAWKGTYTGDDLKPYRRAAERYVKANGADFWIASAIKALRGLIDGAGPVPHVNDARYRLKPRDKAHAALARMRAAKVPPERLLVIALAVSACVTEDPVGSGGGEYRSVQIAKAAHRQASGYHSV